MVSRTTEKDKIFGEKIRQERTKQGRSRREIAEKVRISQQQLQKYEVASNRITAGKLVEIAEVLNLEFLSILPEEFLNFENIDNLAIYLWKKLSLHNKKAVIIVLRGMIK